MHRVFPLSGCLPRFARPPDARSLYRPTLLDLRGRAGDASARYRRSNRRIARSPRDRLLQHYEMLHQGVSGRDSNHGQWYYTIEGTCGGRLLRPAGMDLARPEENSETLKLLNW